MARRREKVTRATEVALTLADTKKPNSAGSIKGGGA